MIAVNVAGLLREASGATRDVRLRDHYVSLGPDLELAGPLNGAIRLHRTNRGILAHGAVGAALRRTCARCLEPYVEEVAVEFDEEYLPLPDAGASAATEDAAREALRIDEHNEIDLAPPIHDELSLTEPMHPLCRPDCPGLCAVCGERLTSGAHDHGDEEIDPRLAGLASLLDRGEDRGENRGENRRQD